MIVAGWDLSYTRSAGVWLDENFKVVHQVAFPIKPGPRRLYRALKSFTTELSKVKPDLCVVEDNAYSAASRIIVVKLAALNTLLKATCEAGNIEWLEVSPSALKKVITGKGTAEKSQVSQEIFHLYGIRFEGDEKAGFDLSDACSAALWGLTHRGFTSTV